MGIEIWYAILYNLEMVAWFMFPLILCRMADIVFGSIIASKSIDLVFDWDKLWHGIMWSVMMIFGLTCLIAGIISLPEIMTFYKIELIDADILKELVNILMIVTLLIGTTVTYGKDSYEKLVQILRGTPSK